MSKATRILNEHHIKELMLRGNPQYENFYKEELIEFCKISKHEIDRLNNIINELEKFMYKDYREIDKFVSGERAISALNEINRINKKLKELKENNK